MPSSPLLAAVREFTTTILNPYDLQELLQRLTAHATTVTGTDGAGIMLAGARGLGFAAAWPESVVDIEVTQDRVESGPCHDAFTSGTPTVVDDLRVEHRWPEYRERALELGFRAIAGFPMHAWGETIGVLDLYRRHPGPWTGDVLDTAEIMTSMGAGYVLHANQLKAQHELAEQLQTALESRDTIGQAKGLLMARHRIGADEAMDLLRETSQRTNVKLRDVAARLVASEGTCRSA